MDIVPCTSGIYKITCTANRKIYVGSAQNLKKRWNEHRGKLRRGVHENPHLQNAWNKHGELTFTFEVIELVMPWSRVDREQYWLDTLKPCNSKIGFNRNPIAGKPPSSKGKKLSQEHRRKLAIASTGKHHTLESRAKLSAIRMGIKYSDETRWKMSNAKRGKKQSPETIAKRTISLRQMKRTPEHIAILTESRTKQYIIIAPDGTEYRVKGLAMFCREQGLNRQGMSAVANGNRTHYRGWLCCHDKELD